MADDKPPNIRVKRGNWSSINLTPILAAKQGDDQ